MPQHPVRQAPPGVQKTVETQRQVLPDLPPNTLSLAFVGGGVGGVADASLRSLSCRPETSFRVARKEANEAVAARFGHLGVLV